MIMDIFFHLYDNAETSYIKRYAQNIQILDMQCCDVARKIKLSFSFHWILNQLNGFSI